MPISFYAELTYATKELTRIKLDLSHADITSISSDQQQKDRSASIRAYSYIWLTAILERTVNDSLKKLIQEINNSTIPIKNLKPSLLALLCDPHINSIAAKSPNPYWEKRIEIFDQIENPSPANFNTEITTLDGRTIRGEHFDRIWKVFNIQGKSLPAPQHRVALKDLADGRNKVAHGEIDPITFGRSKAKKDVIQLTSRVDETITHLLSELDTYCTKGNYSKTS